jgi:hypothetical protein
MSVVMTATPSVNQSNPNTIDWKLCNVTTGQCGTGTKTSPYPAIDLAYNSGPQDVIFVINDSSKIGIQFSNDPLWLKVGAGKPPQGIQSNNQLGTLLQPTPGILIVPDVNTKAQVMSYRLNFVNANNPSQGVTSIDPDWHNGGTGTRMNTSSAVELGIGIATLAAVLFVAYQQSSLTRMVAGIRDRLGKS